MAMVHMLRLSLVSQQTFTRPSTIPTPLSSTAKLMHRRQRSLTPLQSKLPLVKDVLVAVVLCLLQSNSSQRELCGTKSASSAKTATKPLIQSLLAMVLTRTFIVELVMARNGDRMVMDLLVVLASCKLTVKGSLNYQEMREDLILTL